MHIDTLLRDTFADHEGLAPDEAAVMAAVQTRISQRSARYVRPLAVAASIAMVGATAGGAVLLSQHDAAVPKHPVAATTAARDTSLVASTAASHSTARSASIAALTMPFDLGWLPAGSVAYVARRINIGGVSDTSKPSFDGEYMLTVTGSSKLDIDVQQMPGGLRGTRFKSGPGRQTTIHGRRANESADASGPGGYEIYFLNSKGGLVYVNVAAHLGAHASAALLTEIGRRVGAGVRFPGTATVTPTFGLSYLPAGLTMRAFDVETSGGLPTTQAATKGFVTSYDLGTTHTQEPSINVGTNIGDVRSGRSGRHVQGHPTRYLDEKGYRTLYVLGAVHGQPVQIAGRASLAELYKIADGLILPS